MQVESFFWLFCLFSLIINHYLFNLFLKLKACIKPVIKDESLAKFCSPFVISNCQPVASRAKGEGCVLAAVPSASAAATQQ